MLTVTLDARAFIADLDDVSAKQLPFAEMKALNETATDFQKIQRGQLAQSFILRRKTFVEQGIKINRNDFARKDKLDVTIRVDPERDFLTKFEDGGTKEPSAGGHSIALPIQVKRSKTDIIQKTQRPRSFQFRQAASSIKTRMTIYKGDRRTFLIQRPDGFGIILQRVGSPMLGPFKTGTRGTTGASRQYGHDPKLRILYALVAKTHVPRSLYFGRNAREAVLSRWPGNFEKWFLQSLSARKKK